MNPDSQVCPLCGTTKLRQFVTRAFDAAVQGQTVSVCACDACDFAWQWPLGRDEEESRVFFLEEYQGERKGSYFDKERRNAIASLQLEFLDELHVPERTLLDIGCGDGSLVSQAADRGWQSVGLDPAIPVGFLQNKNDLKFELRGGTLEEFSPEAKFGCVTLWDVIEHLSDPEAVLYQSWLRVVPGGWLVLETGNYQSAGRLVAGEHWWNWQLDHRWYFSPSTLLSLFSRLKHSEFRIAKRTLRPWVQSNGAFEAPSKVQTMLSILKRPWNMAPIVAEHESKRLAKLKWPEWAGLEIFVLAVKK